MAVGYAFPLCYLLWSLRYGPFAPPNPWRAAGLEWQTTSPPPTDNFDETPTVSGDPYDYQAIDRAVAADAATAGATTMTTDGGGAA